MNKTKGKNTFVIYKDTLQKYGGLDDAAMGKLFRSILEYENGIQPRINDPATRIVFEAIKVSLDADRKKWENEIEKRKKAGKLGGKASANKRKQNQASASTTKQVLAYATTCKHDQADTVTVISNEINNLSADVPALPVSQSADLIPQSQFPPDLSPPPLFLVPAEPANPHRQTTQEIISRRLGMTIGKPKRGAIYEWQAKAARIAKALKIDIDGTYIPYGEKKPQKTRPSWFNMFSEADKKKTLGQFDQAYALFIDSPTWEKYDNDRKLAAMFFIHHYGIDTYKAKGSFQ